MLALVTGASEGIGKAIATALAADGFELILCARRKPELESFASLLRERYGLDRRFMVYSADLSKLQGVGELCSKIEGDGLLPVVLVNNAGSYEEAPMLMQADSEFLELMQLNFISSYQLSKWVAKHLVLRGLSGHIISVGSVAALEAKPGAGSYSVSKFALRGLMVNLREELKSFGVKVTSILCGPTLTRSWGKDEHGSITGENTASRGDFLEPEDIASAVLCSLHMSRAANIDEILVTPLN